MLRNQFIDYIKLVLSTARVSGMCVIGNFQSLEVVDRGSETQTQVVENLNPFILS